ncbi:hypothetical protein CsSME_00002130 [Camellia sinensis var. sinensis]
MGGCASRPKDLDVKQEPLPAEDTTTAKPVEGETVPQEVNGGESKKGEEPLVDLSEPAKEVAKSEVPSTESKPVEEAKAGSEVAKPSEPIEKTAEPAENKLEAANEMKEEKKEVQGGEPKKVEEVAAPILEDKSDAPLVTL